MAHDDAGWPMNRIAHYLSQDGKRRYSAPISSTGTIPPTHTLSDGTVLTLYLVWHSPTVDTQEA
jgi:hypothetical protein